MPFPAADLLERFDYDPLAGALINRRVNRVLNYRNRNQNSYSTIRYTDVEGKEAFYNTTYGRLVFTWLTGTWPDSDVDHIDRNTENNRPWNLRLATRRENCQNRSNFKGGIQQNKSGTWRVRMRIDGKQRSLGSYRTREEAEKAYQLAASKMP